MKAALRQLAARQQRRMQRLLQSPRVLRLKKRATELFYRGLELYRDLDALVQREVRLPPAPGSGCLYARLGLPFGASAREIQSAYRVLGRKPFSPADKAKLDEAYQVLSDPTRRELYRLTQEALHGVTQVQTQRLRRPQLAITRYLVRIHDYFVR